MNLSPADLAKLHRDQLAAAIAWLEANPDEWKDPDPDQGDSEDTLGPYPDSVAASTEKWARASLDAFKSMLARERFPLSEKQIKWIHDIAERFGVTLPRAPVPRGREVKLAFEGTKLPLKPPGRPR